MNKQVVLGSVPCPILSHHHPSPVPKKPYFFYFFLDVKHYERRRGGGGGREGQKHRFTGGGGVTLSLSWGFTVHRNLVRFIMDSGKEVVARVPTILPVPGALRRTNAGPPPPDAPRRTNAGPPQQQ